MSVRITKADLEVLPGYPQTVHVPLDRLVLDPGDLPEQRRDGKGEAVCWCGPHRVEGNAVLCQRCRNTRANTARSQRRDERRPDVTVSKNILREVHEAVDSLGPLVNDLTVAYNNDATACFSESPPCLLRNEVHQVMLRIKAVERTVRDLLPDPRPQPDHL